MILFITVRLWLELRFQIEEAAHGVEPGEGAGAEFFERTADARKGFFLHVAGFGVEFVGEADEDFLRGFGQEIPLRDRQLLFAHFFGGDAAAGMAFADAGEWFEVDFILMEKVAIETKTTRRHTARDLKGLKALKEEGLFSRYILVCNEDYAQTTEDGIEIVPWRQFLDELWAGKII